MMESTVGCIVLLPSCLPRGFIHPDLGVKRFVVSFAEGLANFIEGFGVITTSVFEGANCFDVAPVQRDTCFETVDFGALLPDDLRYGAAKLIQQTQ